MWFQQKPCPVCQEKDRTNQEKENRLQDLVSQILTLKGQLGRSREREEKALDALLEKKGVAPVTPSPRMTMKDSEDAQKQAFAFFKDEDDIGDGNILEADNLNVHRPPL